MDYKLYEIEGPVHRYYIISNVYPDNLPPGDGVSTTTTLEALLGAPVYIVNGLKTNLKLLQLVTNDNSRL